MVMTPVEVGTPRRIPRPGSIAARLQRLRRRLSRCGVASVSHPEISPGEDDGFGDGAGQREPRRPYPPTLSGAAALELAADGDTVN